MSKDEKQNFCEIFCGWESSEDPLFQVSDQNIWEDQRLLNKQFFDDPFDFPLFDIQKFLTKNENSLENFSDSTSKPVLPKVNRQNKEGDQLSLDEKSQVSQNHAEVKKKYLSNSFHETQNQHLDSSTLMVSENEKKKKKKSLQSECDDYDPSEKVFKPRNRPRKGQELKNFFPAIKRNILKYFKFKKIGEKNFEEFEHFSSSKSTKKEIFQKLLTTKDEGLKRVIKGMLNCKYIEKKIRESKAIKNKRLFLDNLSKLLLKFEIN